VQAARGTDLAFASGTMVAVGGAYPGDGMARHVAEYRDQPADTPVEFDVSDAPTVDVVRRES